MSIRLGFAGAWVAALLSVGSAVSAAPFVIGSNAASGRPFLGTAYSRLQAELLDATNFGPTGVVPTSLVLAQPTDVITGAALAGLDAFVLAEPGPLTDAEVADLRAFALAGGGLVLIADSLGDAGVSALLGALDGSALGGTGGLNGRDVYTLSSTGAAEGPFGDLRGRRVGGTLASTLLPGNALTPVATVGDAIVAGEYARGALGPGSGHVLVMGDPLWIDFFFPGSGSGFDDEDNRLFALNAFAELVGTPDEPPPPPPVPGPATLTMLTAGGACLVRRAQHRGRATRT